jgi:hypothetical protein
MGDRRAFALGAVLGLLVAGAAVASPAAANNFGGPKNTGSHCDDNFTTSQCVAPDWNQLVNLGSTLDSRYQTAMNYAEPLYDDVTGVIVTVGVAYATTNDVRVNDGDFGDNGYYAWTRCASTPNYTGDNGTSLDGYDLKWCMPDLVYFNNWYTDRNYHTTNEIKAIACHELGHTLGLRHKGQVDTTSCMRNNPTFDAARNPTGPLMTPNSHDILHTTNEY